MIRIHRLFQVLATLALLSVAAPATAQESAYRLDVVTFGIGTLPGFENFTVSGAYNVNVTSQGDVLFDNSWSSDTGESGEALWLWSGGNVTLLAMRGLPAPGTAGETFGEYDVWFSRAAPNGDVTFISRIGPDTTAIDQGLWAGPPSALSLVARTGEMAPGTDGLLFEGFENRTVAGYYGIYGAAMNTLGEQVFRAITSDPPDCSLGCAIQEGLWRNTPNGLELVARSGETAPGLSGESFATFPFYVLNDAGEVVAVAETNYLQNINDGDGIWVGQPGALLPLAVRGEVAPGTEGLTFARFFSSFSGVSGGLSGGGTISYLSGPVTNGVGDVGFFAALATADESREIGIWARESGLLQLLAREGDPAPAGEDGIYGTLDNARLHLNEAGQFAFDATLQDSTTSGGGLWLGQPGSLALAVAHGQEVPGFQAAPLTNIFNFHLNDSGALAFTGTSAIDFAPYGEVPARGAWISDPGGVSPILQAGDVLEVAPGDFQTVLEVYLANDFRGLRANGSSRLLSETGDVALIVYFSNSATLYLASPIDPTAPNSVPIADAGTDQSVTEGDVVSLDGTGSSDGDGTPLLFEWSADGVPLGQGPKLSISSLAPGIHSVSLTVTDRQGAVGSDTMTLTVNPLNNQAPVANAGPDQSVPFQATTTLDGTASSDPEGFPLTYVWSLDGSVIATGATPVVGPFDPGPHTIVLTITDPQGASGSDSMVLTSVNDPPVAVAGPDQTIPTLSTTTLDGSGSSDPEGFALTYVWSVDGTQIATGPTPSVGPLDPGSHTVVLTVTDAQGASGSDSLVLTVLNDPPVANAGPDATIQTLETVMLDGSGSSDPEGLALAYSWSLDGVEIATGPAPTVGPFESGSQTIVLTVTDSLGDTASDSLVLTVLNRAPVANAGPDVTVTFTKGRTTTVTLDGTASSDPDGSLVSYVWSQGSTVIGSGATLPVELAKGTHGFTLTVTDDDGATAIDDVVITVTKGGGA